jgi:hypothetical protein
MRNKNCLINVFSKNNKFNCKAQSATEFVVLISFMFVVFFIFFFAIQSQIIDATQVQDMRTLEEASNLVRTYLDLARQSYADFQHSFVLDDLGNFNYEVVLEGTDTLVSKIDNKEYVDFLPFEVKGYVLTGSQYTNVVYHFDGYFRNPSTGKIMYDSNTKGVFLNIDAEACGIRKVNSSCIVPPMSDEDHSGCVSISVCS